MKRTTNYLDDVIRQAFEWLDQVMDELLDQVGPTPLGHQAVSDSTVSRRRRDAAAELALYSLESMSPAQLDVLRERGSPAILEAAMAMRQRALNGGAASPEHEKMVQNALRDVAEGIRRHSAEPPARRS